MSNEVEINKLLEKEVLKYKLRSKMLENRVNFLNGELTKQYKQSGEHFEAYMKVTTEYDNFMTSTIDKEIEGLGK